ncbi:MAG: hypothetical protein SH850_22255 [Planctomycetaceae bacterium]|nr:hypothetical protein [Planctomycetaceae bacterium]
MDVNHFALSRRMILLVAGCAMLWISVHSGRAHRAASKSRELDDELFDGRPVLVILSPDGTEPTETMPCLAYRSTTLPDGELVIQGTATMSDPRIGPYRMGLKGVLKPSEGNRELRVIHADDLQEVTITLEWLSPKPWWWLRPW